MSKFHDLIDGYYKFRGTEWLEERDRWKELAEGQSPRVMVIAGSDSRVEPATIFGSRPGEIFVVRNVANLVPPFETGGGLHGVSAALEFAVTDAPPQPAGAITGDRYPERDFYQEQQAAKRAEAQAKEESRCAAISAAALPGPLLLAALAVGARRRAGSGRAEG